MGRTSFGLVTRAAGSLAVLTVGVLARPGIAQQPAPAAATPAVTQVVPPAQTAQPIDGAISGDCCNACSHGSVILDSIFGKPDPNTWRPLSLGTLFSEGWNEAWVPSPSGSGGAPRQGWINAADGNLYRLNFFEFRSRV